MKLEKLVGERFKERPADCTIDSHALMIRGGYIKQVTAGIFSSFPIMKRITHKIENIVREEMDAIDGQEVVFPVVMPASLWQESGRYESVGKELMRFTDRNDTPLVLGMTHEEAAVHMVREYGNSYTKYPFMIYQIQTKLRDEARPRAGLIRVREFTMKDGYSYHTSQEDLDMYYEVCHKAYERIYARLGLPQVISVESDSGMMGGKVSHEFMFLTPVGEDTIITCRDCDYRANLEAAVALIKNKAPNTLEPLQKVHTPNTKTIEDVCAYLKLPIENSCKAVIYQKTNGEYVVLFIRGDCDANETKIANHIGEEIHVATITQASGLVAGFLGPIDINNAQILFDNSLKNSGNLCCGANEIDYHYTGFNIERDFGEVEYHDFSKATEGGICPSCSQPSLAISRGIEVGNIFQLGEKYTRSMEMKYIDENGKANYPVMGCYGFGVGRTAASVCEAYHDDYGPIWPMAIAPWQVHLCCVKSQDEETKIYAEKLYEQLKAQGIEVIYDDRPVSPGVMFSDADLLGVPIRIIASPRNMKEGSSEIVTRDKSIKDMVKHEDVVPYIQRLIGELMAI
ncbi:MAG: proline--tRNA ligase [Defluviitaleaceae bacterium]|nr:proline--tRNA ligase [Defluviitaleaceae bacterium]